MNCILQSWEIDYTIIEIPSNYIIVDKNIESVDIFVNGKIVDHFNTLYKNDKYTLNVTATQELHKIIMEQKDKTNDLENRLPRLLEAIFNSSLIVDGTTNNGTDVYEKNVYNMERYEQIKEEILKHRCERYRTIRKKDLNIKSEYRDFYFVF